MDVNTASSADVFAEPETFAITTAGCTLLIPHIFAEEQASGRACGSTGYWCPTGVDPAEGLGPRRGGVAERCRRPEPARRDRHARSQMW
jgi:hypothetical protein